jgi:hypothetical protein
VIKVGSITINDFTPYLKEWAGSSEPSIDIGIGLHWRFKATGILFLTLGFRSGAIVISFEQPQFNPVLDKILKSNKIFKTGLHTERLTGCLTGYGYTLNSFFDINPFTIDPFCHLGIIPAFQTCSLASESPFRQDRILPSHIWESVKDMNQLIDRHLYHTSILAIMNQRIGSDRFHQAPHEMLSWENLQKNFPNQDFPYLDNVWVGIIKNINLELYSVEGQFDVDFNSTSIDLEVIPQYTKTLNIAVPRS